MAGKEIAVKKYVVRRDAEERDRLNELIRKGKRSLAVHCGNSFQPSVKVPVLADTMLP